MCHIMMVLDIRYHITMSDTGLTGHLKMSDPTYDVTSNYFFPKIRLSFLFVKEQIRSEIIMSFRSPPMSYMNLEVPNIILFNPIIWDKLSEKWPYFFILQISWARSGLTWSRIELLCPFRNNNV